MNALFSNTLRENRRFLLLLLPVTAAAFLLSRCGMDDLLAFPYAQLGQGLRWLSLSSAVGNILAWAGLIVLGAVPAMIWWWLRKRGRLRRGDWALLVFVPALWGTLYGMVNPGSLASALLLRRGGALAAFARPALALTVDSFALLYLVLRLMTAAEEEGQSASRVLALLLRLVTVTCAALLGATALPEIAEVCSGLGNTLGADTFVIDAGGGFSLGAFLRALLEAAALGLDGWLALLGVTLLRQLQSEPYGEGTVSAAKAMAVFCRRAVTALLTALALVNLLTLLTLGSGGHIQLTLPVLTVAFALLMGLVSRTLADRRALKQENELFI